MSKTAVPDLPCFDCVTDDSPTCHQSLKYWGIKANEVGKTVHDVANGLQNYHQTGTLSHSAGNALSEILGSAAKVFKGDEVLAEPLAKFSDALNRIECYHDMLLTQTQMLGVEPLMKLVKDVEKMKKYKSKLMKASESLHVSWVKFSNLPHASNLQYETQQMEKSAHNMITSRQKYQLLLAHYTESIRNVNTQKKVFLLQRILEHMLAEFSYFNYCSQILKELEPYMNSLFEDVQSKVKEFQKMSVSDEESRKRIEADIDMFAQAERNMFPIADQGAMTIQSTGRFLNKVGGFISSGVKDLKKYKEGSTKSEEQDWEMIDTPATKEETDDQVKGLSPRSASLTATHFYLPLNDDKEPTPESVIEPAVTNTSTVQNTNVDAISTAHNTDVDGSNKNKVHPAVRPQCAHDDAFHKKGYLRIKQKAFPKSKYPLLYFILDKKYGELLSQGQDQKLPVPFARLMLSSVKPCGTETDRNYCFQLFTSDAEYILQARNQQDLQEWIKAIQDGIASALDNGDDRRRSNARGSSVKEFHRDQTSQSVCHNAVERIKAVEGNNLCADCDCPRPGWASSNIGVVFCIECSGVHRGLGVHISKVKSLSLDKWDVRLVEFMEQHGNKKENSLYEANLGDVKKITREATKVERLDYIKRKYVEREFYGELNKEPAVEHADENGDEEPKSLSNESAVPGNSEVNASVLCLVQNCHDCETGKHGSRTLHNDSLDFQSTRLSFDTDNGSGVPESTL